MTDAETLAARLVARTTLLCRMQHALGITVTDGRDWSEAEILRYCERLAEDARLWRANRASGRRPEAGS